VVGFGRSWLIGVLNHCVTHICITHSDDVKDVRRRDLAEARDGNTSGKIGPTRRRRHRRGDEHVRGTRKGWIEILSNDGRSAAVSAGGVRVMVRRYNLALNFYFVAVFVGIGGLQMYRVNAGFLTNYGADLLAPPYLYLMLRGGRMRLSSLTALGVVLGGCFVWEWLQRFDLTGTPLAITRGRFDPFDLLAYSLGLLAVYVLDVRWLRPRGLVPARRQPSRGHADEHAADEATDGVHARDQ
jgi:hypothetical protein